MSKIYQIRYRDDKTSFDIISAEIVGGTTGDTVLRVEAPFDSNVFTCGLDFLLATGKEAPRKTGNFITTLQVDSNGDGNTETFWRYQYEFDTDITSVSNAQESTPLILTTVFTDSVNNVVKPMNAVDMVVNRSVDPNRPDIPPNEVARLDGVDATKRERLSTNLTSIDFDETNYITVDQTSGSGQGEHKVTVDEISQKIEDDIGGKSEFAGYPTDGDSGITPQFSFGGGEEIGADIVSRTVDNTDDADFDKDNPVEVLYTIQASGVWENAFQSVYPIGFGGINGTLNDTRFTQSIKAKTDGASFDVRTMYFIYSDTNGIAAQAFHTGAILNFSTTEFSNQAKLNSVIEFTIDLSIDERIYTLTQVNGTIGTLATAEIEDDSNTLSNWQLATSAALQNKIDKIPNAVEDNLACQQSDGGLKDCEIGKNDVARLTTDQSFTGIKTFDELLTALQGMNITGDLTVDGNLFVINGTGTEILTDELKVEDLVATYAVGNPTASVQTGHDFEIGVGVKWAITRDADGEFRIGLTTDKKIVARIQDNPQEDLILTYDITTKTLINRTNQDILDILDIQISDVEDLTEQLLAVNNKADSKITGLELEGGATNLVDIKKIIFTGGFGLIQSGTNEATLDIQGNATGEGEQTVARADADPIIDVPLIDTLLDITIRTVQSAEDGQSTDESVMKLFDQDDVTIPNTLQIFKTASIQNDNPILYSLQISGIGSNDNQVNSVDLIFRLEADGVLIWEKTKTISEASVQQPLVTNNFGFTKYFETDPLEDDQDLQLFIRASDIGVDLDSLSINYESKSTQAQAVSGLMNVNTFATNGTNRVDRAVEADGVVVYDTTNPQTADLVANDILDMVAGNKYTFNITGTMDSSQITLSKDNQANSYSTFEEDGTTPAIGTDYNGITKITVDFDGVKCSIVSLDKIVDDVEARVTANETDISNINILDSEVLAMPTSSQAYDFNGTTSKAVSAVETSFNAETIYIFADMDSTGAGSAPMSFNNDIDDAILFNLSSVAGAIEVRSGSGNNTKYTEKFNTGINKMIFRHNGTTYDCFLNGVKLTITSGTSPLIAVVKTALGLRESSNSLFDNSNFGEVTISSHTLTDQEAIDITDDTVTALSLLTKANSERVYIANEDSNPAIIENQSTLSAQGDLTATDVTFVAFESDWAIDGTFPIYFSTEITTTLTIGEFDKVNPVGDLQTQAQLDSWNNMNISRIEFIDVNTLKFFAIQPNIEALNFLLGITRKDGGIT